MRVKCRNFKNISAGCLLAPAAYIFCAYISIYCTFADKWSYREFTCATIPLDNSYNEQQQQLSLDRNQLPHPEDKGLRVDQRVTGVASSTNGTLEFHTIYMPSNLKTLPKQKVNQLSTSQGKIFDLPFLILYVKKIAIKRM